MTLFCNSALLQTI